MSLYVKFLQLSNSLFEKRDVKLDEHAIKLIKLDIPHYFELLDNGYIPNKIVNNIFTKKLNNLIIKNDLKDIDNAIENNNFQLSTENALLLLKSVPKKYKYMKHGSGNYDHTHNFNQTNFTFDNFDARITECFNSLFGRHFHFPDNITNQIIDISHTKEFQDSLFNYFIELADIPYKKREDSYYINLVSSYLLLETNQFNKISLDDYLKISNDIKESAKLLVNKDYIYRIFTEENSSCTFSRDYEEAANSLSRTLNKLGNKFSNDVNVIYKENMDGMTNKSKVTFLGENANKIAVEQISLDLKEKLNSNYLPKKSLKIINSIQHKYNDILKSNSDSNITEDSDKIINKKLPSVINKYLSISDEYKTTMTNSQGKNAEDLLIESLASIDTLLENNLNALQNDNLKDLSAQNRFLKSKIAS